MAKIGDLSPGGSVSSGDLLITRQGADTVDKTITPAQLNTFVSSATATLTNKTIAFANNTIVIDADDIDDTSTTNKFTTAGDISKLAGIEAGADVTDTANVTAAGALMDSEVDADIKTLSLPANTTISTFGASLVDDADAAAARTTLNVDAAGTDNSTNVTLAGQDFLSLSGQEITANAINIDNLSATGTPDATTFLRGDNTWATPSGSSPLTTKGDIYTYSTSDARLAVGTNGQALVADSAETTGLKWETLTTVETYLVDDGIHTITSASGVATPDAANGHSQKFPLTENVTDFNPPTNLADGESMLVQVLQDSTPRTFTLDAAWVIMGTGVASDIGSLTAGQYAWLSITRYGTDYLISITAEA